MLAVPASAVALTTGAAESAAPASAPAGAQAPGSSLRPLKVNVTPRRLGFGRDVTVTGTAPPADAGRTLWLQTAPSRRWRWRRLSSTQVGRDGHFRLAAPLRESGLVRVFDPSAGSTTTAPGAISIAIAGDPAVAASAPQSVLVGAELAVAKRSFSVLGGRAIAFSGRLLPARPGRPIRLQARFAGTHHWRTLAGSRTGTRGGFRLRYVAGEGSGAAGSEPLRVLFSGDRHNASSRRRIGQLTVYNQSVASWYEDAGGTACGFHATFGVANRDLPCGTRVSFRHAGRTVNAVVDDRGPFVSGRDWDLNQNTAGALAFSGVDTVWSTR